MGHFYLTWPSPAHQLLDHHKSTKITTQPDLIHGPYLQFIMQKVAQPSGVSHELTRGIQKVMTSLVMMTLHPLQGVPRWNRANLARRWKRRTAWTLLYAKLWAPANNTKHSLCHIFSYLNSTYRISLQNVFIKISTHSYAITNVTMLLRGHTVGRNTRLARPFVRLSRAGS